MYEHVADAIRELRAERLKGVQAGRFRGICSICMRIVFDGKNKPLKT